MRVCQVGGHGFKPRRTNTQGLKITDSSGVVQPFMSRVGNEGVDIKLDVRPVSSPVTEKFNKVSIKYMLGKQRIP